MLAPRRPTPALGPKGSLSGSRMHPPPTVSWGPVTGPWGLALQAAGNHELPEGQIQTSSHSLGLCLPPRDTVGRRERGLRVPASAPLGAVKGYGAHTAWRVERSLASAGTKHWEPRGPGIGESGAHVSHGKTSAHCAQSSSVTNRRPLDTGPSHVSSAARRGHFWRLGVFHRRTADPNVSHCHSS